MNFASKNRYFWYRSRSLQSWSVAQRACCRSFCSFAMDYPGEHSGSLTFQLVRIVLAAGRMDHLAQCRFQGSFGIEGKPLAPGICGTMPLVALPLAHEPRMSVAC